MSADFLAWLTAWLRRHPVQDPPQHASYAQEVLARVKTQDARAAAPAWRWMAAPRLAWMAATVAACGLALVCLRRLPSQTASVQDAVDVLAAVGELDHVNAADLEQEAVFVDQMVLAEAQADTQDDAWLQETLELLNQVDDKSAVDAPESGASPDELLKELEQLDESEITSS